MKGYINVNKNNVYKKIKPVELNNYLNEGWALGARKWKKTI